jgi:hypothetical protein
MPNTVADKLKIKPGFTLLTVNAPADFKIGLEGLPAAIRITDSGNKYEQIHWFVVNKAEIEKNLSRILKLLKPGVIVWAYYPKRTSKMQTDLSRDKGWESLLKHHDKLAWINLISFNDTWSVFGFRAKTDEDKKKEAKPKQEREIFKWSDPVKKEVRLPEDFANALKNHKKLEDYYHSLAYSHRREWVEWIVTAKKEETRSKRIKEALERLKKKWKNPANN